MIGSLGDAEFYSSENEIYTFDGLAMSMKSTFAEHKIIGRTSVLEFTGHDASTVSMNITLDVTRGLYPHNELTKLSRMMNRHEAVPFILGGNVIGRGLWVIESMNVQFADVGSDGFLYSAKVALSLKEYMNEAV